MTRLSDLLTAYQTAMARGDMETAHEAIQALLFEQNVPAEVWPDAIFNMSWAYSCGLAAGIQVAREAISAGKSRPDTSPSSPEARILRDLRDREG